jgi:hypothetical protein
MPNRADDELAPEEAPLEDSPVYIKTVLAAVRDEAEHGNVEIAAKVLHQVALERAAYTARMAPRRAGSTPTPTPGKETPCAPQSATPAAPADPEPTSQPEQEPDDPGPSRGVSLVDNLFAKPTRAAR